MKGTVDRIEENFAVCEMEGKGYAEHPPLRFSGAAKGWRSF
ncbi:MAG: hypothetical protein ACLR6B_10295 [Blautia sp.]